MDPRDQQDPPDGDPAHDEWGLLRPEHDLSQPEDEELGIVADDEDW